MLKDTKTIILDTAENLFASNGFKRTSIKVIAKKAGVNIAAVNYHFGSKNSLIQMVIRRRFVPINETRLKLLCEIKNRHYKKDIKPSVEEILHAFIDPLFDSYKMDNKNKCLISIACQIFLEQDETILKEFILLFKEPLQLFYELLNKAFPFLPEEILSWRIHYAIGAMIYCMRIFTTRFPVQEIAPHQELPIDYILNNLVEFIMGGFSRELETS
jgi:AcrR family transcriptional regulator